MFSQTEPFLDAERTEALPAQEKIAIGDDAALVLSAEQVFTLSFFVTPQNGCFHTQGLVP
ncbi:MAG: hypothetical protein NTW32_07970 [Chloroflexi bacterium]|nr:hypothetical protein [Chloroflexota bacterium]